MIPILYSSTETAFTSNGIGRLRDCISAKVTEQRNGIYELEFVYPITGRLFNQIEDGRFIGCTHEDSSDIQPFKIYKRTAPIDGKVTFNARHISYALSNVILNPFTANSASQVMALIPSNSINTNPFTFWTDKTTTATFTLSEPASVRSILGGTEGSILDVFGGGEYEFDKYTVKFYQHRGLDTGYTIRYGKNLADLEQTVDTSNVYNAIVPFWRGEETGTLVLLDERIVTADGVTNPKPVIMDMSDEFEEQPSQNQLRIKAQNYLVNNTPWVPKENINIDFVALWQTTQYRDVANLQRVRLCDTVNVHYPALGVTALNIKVVKTVYNVLLNRYDEMELGDPRTNFGTAMKADYDSQIAKAVTSMQGFMDSAIENATSLITGGKGGHVVFGFNANGKPEEILIMDTEDLATATNIIRLNVNGIGFSTNGGQTYTTAWTIDGRFVADFITAGTLNANLIKAGTISDTQGYNYWNLQTGEFRLSANTQVGSNTTLGDLAYKDSTIVEVDVEYALGNSSTTAPTTGWSTNTPTWQQGKYIWQRTKTVDGNGDASYSNPTCIQGAKGEDGNSVSILGSYNTLAELQAAHPTGNQGDGYLVAGDLYVWNGSAWEDVGTIQGPAGAAGANGINNAAVVLYKRGATAPSKPTSTLTYTFATGVLSGSLSGWSQSIPSGTDPVWMIAASASSDTATDNITSGEWGTQTKIIENGTNGTNGTDGYNTATIYLYRRSATTPSKPTATPTYTFATGALSATPSGWSRSVPSGTDPCYMTTAAAVSQNPTVTVSGWSDVVKLVEDGTDGINGIGVSALVEQYYLSDSSTTQTGGSWSTSQPTWVSGKYIWTRSQVTWSDGTVTTTDPVLAKAINSANQSAKDANDAVTTLNTALDQQEIFNRLTNNGQSQGIYLQNGLLYINAQYMVTGRLADATGNSYWDLSTGVMNFVGNMTMQKENTYNRYLATVGDIEYIFISKSSNLISNHTGIGFEQSMGYKPAAGEEYEKSSTIGLEASYSSATLYAGATDESDANTFTAQRAYRTRVSGVNYATGEYIDNAWLLKMFNADTDTALFNLTVSGSSFDYRTWNGSTQRYFRVSQDTFQWSGEYGGITVYNARININSSNSSGSSTVSLNITSSAQTINGKTIQFASTSSRRYKEGIKPVENADLDPHRLYDLEVKQFKYHDGMILQYDDMQYKTHVGFIAEEVNEVYPDAVIHDVETGQVESWDERRIIPPMLKLIQEQKAKIDELETRIARLEALLSKE